MSDSTELLDQNEQPAAEQVAEPPKDTRTAEQKVADLLSGKTPNTKEPETAQDDAPGGDAKDDSDKEVQEADDGEPETEDPEAAKAFYAQEVKLSNGEVMTIGQMKDLAQDYSAKQVELVERENGVMRQRNELEEMGQYLQLPPEVLERIQVQQRQYLTQEHHNMLAAIPEFKDQVTFEKGRVAIFELGQEYGVDLSRVTDHRVVKMLHDYARLKSSIKTARDNVKQIRVQEPKAKNVAPKGQRTDLNNAITRAKTTGNPADQERAVELLLKG